MNKTDPWPEFIKAVIIFLVGYLPSILAGVAAVRFVVKGWVDVSKEKSVGQTAIDEVKKGLAEERQERIKMQVCIEENQELEAELAELKKSVDKLRDMGEKNSERVMEWLIKGNK